MSDPVTNVEIEDVLSSIRRLVSTDERPEKVAEATAAAPVSVDKLVLTPALRVDESDVSDQSASHDEPMEDPETSDHAVAEGTMRDWSDDGDDGDEQDDTSFDVAGYDDDRDPETDQPDGAADSAIQDAEDEDQQASELTSHIAEIEDAVAAREDEWEPDGYPEDDNAAQPMTTLPWDDHTPEAEPEDDVVEATSESVSVPETPDIAPENEGLDPFVSEDDDAEEADIYAGEALPPPSGNAFMAGDDLLDDEDDALLDEDSLRDLVAEIVREELQGSLGERITRNVRKLVRREIQRALAAQELE